MMLRSNLQDQGYKALAAAEAGNRSSPKWKVGEVIPLEPGTAPPFLGAKLEGGEHMLAIDTNLFQSPAHPHECHGDFLVIRHPEGQMFLREVTGSILLGQQHPREAVPAPGSPEYEDLLVKLLSLHVWRIVKKKDEEARLSSGGKAADVRANLKLL